MRSDRAAVPPTAASADVHPAGSGSASGAFLHVWSLGWDDEALLPDEERQRAWRFADPADRMRFVARRARLRVILAGYLGCSPRAVRFGAGADGKPLVDGLHFSLSSTGNVAALAVSRDGPLGLDIETVRPVDAAAVRRSLTAREAAALEALPEAERPRAFCRVWTRKEAYLKARGMGLRVDPRSCEVTLGARPGLLACASGKAERWRLLPIPLAAGLEGTLCVGVS